MFKPGDIVQYVDRIENLRELRVFLAPIEKGIEKYSLPSLRNSIRNH